MKLSTPKACRSTRRALNNKTVWMHLVRLMCADQGIFPPSFPMATMDLAQIQRAALGPSRLARVVSDHSTRLIDDSVLKAKLIEAAAHVSVPIESVFGTAPRLTFLVPGGRFLVAVNKSNHCMRLLDLGPPAQMRSIPLVVAETELGHLHEPHSGDMHGNWFAYELAVCFTDAVLTIAVLINDGKQMCVQTITAAHGNI